MPEPDRSPDPNESAPDSGVHLDAQRDVNIGGDVVGRDKIEQIQGDKVIGRKYVLQIGSFNVPLVPLLGGLGIGLAILIFIGLNVANLNQQFAPTPTPGRMSASNFNVVVAEFGEAGADGKVRVTDRSHALSQSVYDTLMAQRDAFPDPIIKSSIALRYGNLPVAANLIPDETAAATVVDAIGADMLIYGNLDANGDFTPQFYVSPQVRGEIDALLTGQQSVGTVRFAPGVSFDASTDLRTRASALFFIATGLTYDVFGRSARSLEVYNQAEQTLSDWPERGAGKEILYFFKGQAALFQAQQTTGAASTDLLNTAEAAFQKAIASNSDYARAHIGLGSVNYVRVQQAADPGAAIDSTEMQTMLKEYDLAPGLAQQAGDALAEQVGVFSQGLGAYQLGRAYRTSDRAQASARLDEALQKVTLTIEPFAALKQPRLVAQAYLALGAIDGQRAEIAQEQGDPSGAQTAYRAAQQAYQQCMAQAAGSADRILTELIARDRCGPQLERVTRLLGGQ